MPKTLTPDMVIAIGLVISLIISIILGTGGELNSTIAAGLVGYLGRTAQTKITENKVQETK